MAGPEQTSQQKRTSRQEQKQELNKGQGESEKATKSMDKAVELLQAKADTSRFVGLALLKSLLDNHAELRNNKDVVTRCWKAVPKSFLDRLLKAKPNEKRPEEEAQNMIGLAVAVIHAFMTLLPHEDLDHESFKVYLDELSAAEPFVSQETAAQISQISLTLCFPSLRFPDKAGPKGAGSSPYLFVKMLLIDIRSTLPSLQEKLNSAEYPATSSRLAESYDVISNFVGYLVRSLDDEDAAASPQILSLEPSQLLQLRTDISETMSLTIEHLRDRYDASVAGAAGLHPSVRTESDPNSSAALSIAWESSSTSMTKDPLTLSEARTLALWLREDDNDPLRREAAGIMDVLLGLYDSEDARPEIRPPVLTALEGILEVPEGIEAFLREEGWEILVKDLRLALLESSQKSTNDKRGFDIVRALLTVAESEVVGPAKQEWVNVVDLALENLQKPDNGWLHKDLQIAVCQLVVEVLTKLPKAIRRRQASKATKLSRIARTKLPGSGRDASDGLWEVIDGLEALAV